METWELLKEKVEEDDKSMVVGKKPKVRRNPRNCGWNLKVILLLYLTDLSKTAIYVTSQWPKTGKIDSFSETYLYIYVLKIFT